MVYILNPAGLYIEGMTQGAGMFFPGGDSEARSGGAPVDSDWGLLDEGGGLCGDALAAAGESEMLGGGGFYGYGR